jgi:hypothetical protein
MRTLASIIKTPRRLARDAREQFADATEFFEGGLDTLAEWCGDNLASKDIEKLIDRLSCTIHDRTVNQVRGAVTGAEDSRPRGTPSAAKGFATRYPTARNIKRIF